MVGKKISHYRILKEIGKGGMGVVYKAEDTKLHRIVAIKALAADLVGDEKARARFLREARAASAIDHPNICTVYEINEVDGILFFVMPYIEGRTLKKSVGRRPPSFETALDYSLQLADALVEAHRRNVIHRDIKSSNVMVNERGQLKILDFGLAKLTRAAEQSPDGALLGDLTQVGSPFGTASYMSPEQARGERADARSDIFSLGIVLYETFTGRLPFKGKNSVDVMHAVVHSDPAPLGEGFPPKLQEIISRMLEKSPSDRYQSAERLLQDIREVVRDHYSGRGTIPAERIASLNASRRQETEGLLGRLTSWARRALSISSAPRMDSSGSGSATRDVTPSRWQSRDKKVIAILPFKNLSGSQENDFYGFSLADSVITELAQLRDLIVRPSSYIAQYQNKDVDPREVGSHLAVDAVLVGNYVKSGDRFRLLPQLVDTISGEIVWTDKIDVDARDIITIQDTISRQIVEGLRVKTSSKEQERLVKSPTLSADAYENSLKGRTLLYKFITQTLDIADLDAAVDRFRDAIESDPGFALAHSGLGVCYLNYVLKGMRGVEYFGLAKNSFERALDIDARLVEPRVRSIYIDLYEGRSEDARREIRRLLRQAPNEPSVHSTAAYVYRLSGENDKALEQWNEFLKISPTEIVFASYNRARLFIYERELAKAEAEIEQGAAFEPQHPLLRTYSGVIEFYRGDIDRATTILEEVFEKNPDLHSYKIFLAFCYMTAGDRERALRLIDDDVVASAHADQDTAYRLATLYALDNDADLAVEWLEKAICMGNENYPWFAINPNWDSVREDPRVVSILEDLRVRWERLTQSEPEPVA